MLPLISHEGETTIILGKILRLNHAKKEVVLTYIELNSKDGEVFYHLVVT